MKLIEKPSSFSRIDFSKLRDEMIEDALRCDVHWMSVNSCAIMKSDKDYELN